MTDGFVPPPMEEPLAELERRLIAEYVRNAGESLDDLTHRTDPRARKILRDAATYAAARLAEVEARSHYIRRLHGDE